MSYFHAEDEMIRLARDAQDKINNDREELSKNYPKNRLEIKKYLETTWGEVWTTDEAKELFEFEAFASGLAVVTRRSDGVRGSLNFHSSPRFYFDFVTR